MEEWVQIKEAEEGYKVSSLGRVITPRGRIMSPGDNGHGYLYLFCKHKNGKYKRHYIHRLVCSHFLENPDNLKYVNHRDSDKSNNRVDNLEWVSAKQNTKHGIENGRINKKGRGWTKHSDELIRLLYLLHSKLGVSLSSMERDYGVSRTTMASIISGQSRPHLLLNF